MILSRVPNKSLIRRALCLPLRLIPKEAQVRILQGPLHGKRWIAGSSNHGWWLGTYEYEKQRAFSTVVRAGDAVYDLGANVGFYSLLASFLVGSEGQVFSFEPLSRNLSFLRRHLDLNQITNCSVFDVAVSSSNGLAGFDFGPTPCQGHLTSESKAALTVRTATLDSLVASGKLPPPNVIKCDIEGGEYDALTGARDTLSRYLPSIFLATHGPEVHARCCELLSSIGYNLTPLDELSLNQSREILAAGWPGTATAAHTN